MPGSGQARGLAAAVALLGVASAGAAAPGGGFAVRFGGHGIASLQRGGDPRRVEFVRSNSVLGDCVVRYRAGDGPWQAVETAKLTNAVPRADGPDACAVEYALQDTLRLTVRFAVRGDVLAWTIGLQNRGTRPLELGDLELPLPMPTDYTWNKEETFETRLYRHQFIAGHGSFLFWQPVGGRGPHLVMLPEPGTSLEYFTEAASDYAHGGGRFAVFIHSAATGPGTKGTWRLPHTGRTLAPGQDAAYGFSFRWADDLQGVREALFSGGGFDVQVAPGMVVPEHSVTAVALRTRNRIARIEPEFPGETRIEHGKTTAKDTSVYRVTFARLGENRLTVRYGDGQALHLEFFVTQPLETLIRKRAAFIATKQQHRAPGKWYDGLFSLWDVRQPEGRNLLGPENTGGQHPYAVSGSDDPSNGKCLYLSEKNAAYPDPREIEALEYFIAHFVWGKHQRTDGETPYPYGIYGADSWQQNRFTDRDPLDKQVSRPGGPSACRMWRTFDYTTYFAMYFNMYRIAKQNPGAVKYLDAKGYLARAYGTARAFFEVPGNIRMEGGWSFTGWVYWSYTIGNFHEKCLLPLIAALEAEGQPDEAAYLRGEWEKKVKYFVYDDVYPWVSEMPVDSTAFESTYAVSRYALTQPLQPDEKLWQDRNSGRWFSHPAIDKAKHRDFLQRQSLANLACRGSIEPAYYLLGSDLRGCGESFYMLSYMSQMGGWALLDQALRFDADPYPLLRVGYASLLSSWALLNAGTPASGFGYWYPGALHDGAAGWGFTTQKSATEWNPTVRNSPRGAWPVDGEIDHGLAAYVEVAATVVADDPLFGWTAYGGTLERASRREIRVVPQDGVRQRLHVVAKERRLHVGLDRDGFAAGQAVVIGRECDRLAFVLENRGTTPHTAALVVEGLPPGTYRAAVAGQQGATVEARPDQPARFELPVAASRVPVRIEPLRL